MFKPNNVRVHRAAANSLNIDTRATQGFAYNALLSADAVTHWQIQRRIRLQSTKLSKLVLRFRSQEAAA